MNSSSDQTSRLLKAGQSGEDPEKSARIILVSPATQELIQGIIEYLVLVCFIAIVLVWLGAEYENYYIQRTGSTIQFYTSENVCALVETRSGSVKTQTFDSVSMARNATETITVAHCGDCGACSNPHDIQIYDKTKYSLLGTSYKCAQLGLRAGRESATNCMKEEVGLSSDCEKCWVDNIMCDLRLCIFTCMWQGMFHNINNGKKGQTLNRCTLCDERRCGPQFLRCAGANRRRSGILSDIKRDLDKEVCHKVQPDWWNDADLQEQWFRQQN